MIFSERQEAIIDRLKRDGSVFVRELADDFDVSMETIRRDLEKLEAEDIISRSYGRAVLKRSADDAISFLGERFPCSEADERIAKRAASIIQGSSRVMIDSGTTAFALLSRLQKQHGLNILTNSARAFSFASSCGADVHFTGGKLAQTFSLIGPTAVETVCRFAADVAAICCKGLEISGGALESDADEAAVKREMLKHAKKRLLLADSTKFGAPAFIVIAPWECIDIVVTDKQPPQEWQEFFEKQEIEVIVAE